jgi:hypothetical protein
LSGHAEEDRHLPGNRCSVSVFLFVMNTRLEGATHFPLASPLALSCSPCRAATAGGTSSSPMREQVKPPLFRPQGVCHARSVLSTRTARQTDLQNRTRAPRARLDVVPVLLTARQDLSSCTAFGPSSLACPRVTVVCHAGSRCGSSGRSPIDSLGKEIFPPICSSPPSASTSRGCSPPRRDLAAEKVCRFPRHVRLTPSASSASTEVRP